MTSARLAGRSQVFRVIFSVCAELCIWGRDLPHQWPEHGSPLQPAQQQLEREHPGSTAQLRRLVWNHRSSRCEVPGEEERFVWTLQLTPHYDWCSAQIWDFSLSPSHSRFWHHRPAALTGKEQWRRGGTAEILRSHQQSAFTSQIPARLLSGEAPVQVGMFPIKHRSHSSQNPQVFRNTTKWLL